MNKARHFVEESFHYVRSFEKPKRDRPLKKINFHLLFFDSLEKLHQHHKNNIMGDSDKNDMVVVGTNGEVDGEGGVKTVNKRIIAQKV